MTESPDTGTGYIRVKITHKIPLPAGADKQQALKQARSEYQPPENKKDEFDVVVEWGPECSQANGGDS